MDVLCVGQAAWDISLFVDGYPPENSKCEIHTMLECGGGPAANAAYLLARWGVPCGIAAAIGADAYGDRIAAEFLAAGANVTLLDRRSANVTPVSVILVNQQSGSRTIVNRKALGQDGVLRRLPAAVGYGSPRVLLFDGHELQASLDAMDLFPDAKTILDAGSVRSATRELAKKVDYLVCSERFACQMSGLPHLDSPENQARAIASLYAANGHPVVITQGERGMLRGTDQRVERWPAFPVEAVDTTAAGDIFHGAFAYGVVTGLSDDATLQLAAAAAALSATARGGRTSIPSLPQALELLRGASLKSCTIGQACGG
jgi:sugar/nucleoside kinase (ribokinase family)